MSTQAPSIGAIVDYRLSDADVDRIVEARMSGEGHGNVVREGDVYPAMVVRVFGSTAAVNLQVFLDGDHVYWATSRDESESGAAGTWSWPLRS